jgi:tRNA nucleotidyltransferase (CCA-adding enzyme)
MGERVTVGTTGALTGLMAALLPAGARRLLALVGEAARRTEARPFLVGGTVRDLLLGLASEDLDLVVEGDAGALALDLGAALGAPVTLHAEFGTASLALPWADWRAVGDAAARLPAGADGLHLDLASTRTETYLHPGALPDVTTGCDLADDLRRRDFASNAMAVTLLAGEAGRLIDPHGGEADLNAGRLEVLHPASFVDDPTRLLRGARLAGRYGLRFAPATEALAREAVAHGRLGSISGDRRRHELELLLAEARPALGLAMARAHGLLEQIHPALRWDAWLAERLGRSVGWAAGPAARVRLALLAYRWPIETVEGFVALLRPDGAAQTALEALPRWRDERLPLLQRAAGASAVVEALDGLPDLTLAAARLAEDDADLTRKLDWYATELRHVKPRLDGNALRRLGLPPGPRYRPILKALRRAALDGQLPDEAAEWAFLERMIAEQADDSPETENDGDADAEL